MVGIRCFDAEEYYPLVIRKSLLSMVIGSIGSNMFRHLYRAAPDGPEDVIEDGNLSCAFYTSSILALFDLTQQGVHTWVRNTIKDMVESGWVLCDEPGPARIVVWEKVGTHFHIGFCLDNKRAVSTYDGDRQPACTLPREHWIVGSLKNSDGAPRQVVEYYKHPALEA